MLVVMIISPTFAQGRDDSMDDVRERLVRLESKVDGLQKQIELLQKQIDDLKASTQKQIDDLKASTQKQIDDLRGLLLWGFGILFGGMGLLIGFVIWDRRTAVAPVARRTMELEEREERIELALRILAKKDPKIEEALKEAGLL